MKMTARSLFDTFFYIGMSMQEAYRQCENQGIFTIAELMELRKDLRLQA